MAAKRQTKRRVSKRKNIFDPLSLYYAAGTAQDLGRFMPSQRAVNKFVGAINPKGHVLDMTSQFMVNGRLRTIAAGTPVTITQTSGKRVFVQGDWDGPFSGWIDKAYVRYEKRNPEDIEFLNDLAPYPSQGHLEFTPDGIERFVRGGYVYRAFSNTPVFGDGYRVGTPEGYAEELIPEYASNPAKFERCVKAVQARGGANGYAVCTAEGLRNPRIAEGNYLGTDGNWEYWEWRGQVFRNRADSSGRGYMIDPVTSIALRERETGGIPSGSRFEAPIAHFDKYIRPTLKLNPKRKRRNPLDQSDEVYESFHGVPPTETLIVKELEHVHGNLAGLGDLTEIVVLLTGGSKKGGTTTLTAPNPQTASDKRIVRVASNEARNQMYLVGGDQQVDVQKLGFRDSFDVTHDGETFEASELKDLMVIGEIQKLTYQTRKEADGFKLIDYFHQLGEDTQVRPFLLYDTMNDRMKIAGGQYHIHDVGIVN